MTGNCTFVEKIEAAEDEGPLKIEITDKVQSQSLDNRGTD